DNPGKPVESAGGPGKISGRVERRGGLDDSDEVRHSDMKCDRPSPDPDLARIDVQAAARRLAGVVRETALQPFALPEARIELRLKLECRQETNSFKARGAWNQIAQLTAPERAAGVVTTSSGNHGRAVAWAARRAGVHA